MIIILKFFLTVIMITGLFFSIRVPGYGQSLQDGSVLYGRILFGDEGAAYVTVSVKGTSIGTSSDSHGNFMLKDMYSGRHILKIQGIGYRSIEKEIEIERGENRELNFYLEQDIHPLEQVTVSGSRVGILRYLPGSANTISSRELKVVSPLSGNEVLRQITGVHVVEEEGAGLRTNIGIRGLDPDKSRNVLILEDGIPVALAPYGEPEMYYTPSIDRMNGVEILKGSGSILYGPQTIGGVINYITADPPAESSGFVSLNGGQGSYFTAHLGYGNTFGNTGFQINYLRRQAENLGPTAFGLNEITSKLRFRASPRSSVMVKLGIYDEESNSTYVGLTQVMYDQRDGDFLRLAPDDNLDIRRYSLGVSHDFRISDDLRVNTIAFGYTTTRNWRRQDFTSNPDGPNLTGVVWGNWNIPGGAIFMRNSTGNRNRQFEVAGLEPRLRYRYTIGDMDNILDAGTRILYERAFEQRINGTTAEATSGFLRDDEIRTGHAFSVWAQNKLLVGENFSFTAGLRTEMLEYERYILRSNSTDVNIRNNSVTSAIIPGAGINYNFNSVSGIFAGVHRGFAPPRIKDAITSEGVDLHLDAEKSWNYELGTRAELFGLLGFELTVFYMDFSNQVIPVSESSGGAGSGYINGGRTNHRGIETELRLNISEMVSMPGSLSLNLNTTVTGSVFSGDRFIVQSIGKGETNDDVFVNVRGNRTPYAPGMTASGYLHFEAPGGFGVRLGGNFTGRQYTDVLNTGDVGDWFDHAANNPEYDCLQATASGRIGRLSSFFVMNVSTWYDMPNNFSINFVCKNLLDERYIASRRPQGIRVGLPRIVTAGLNYRF